MAIRNLIILPDGTELFSGNSRENAVVSATYKQMVNSGTELTIGSTCACSLSMKLFAAGGNLSIGAGTEFDYYKVDDDGTRTKIGVFTMEKPTKSGANTYSFEAYDHVSRLDKDLTDWLAALDGWPYTVEKFAEMACTACDLMLAEPPTVNGDYQIREFSGSGITGRKLMQWLGEISCRFIRANADGEIEFAWYQPTSVDILPRGEFAYFGGSLSYEDFSTARIEKVQIQVTDEDNGTIYPDGDEEEKNTYRITGNYLLTAETSEELKPVAHAIYQQLQLVTYTPCKVSIRANTSVNAGDIVRITDINGVEIESYVMSKTNSGQKDTLECTGSHRRDSTTATNDLSLKALNGKVLNVQKSVDGLKIENADTNGNVAALTMSVEALRTSVEDTSGQVSRIEQSASEISVKVQKLMDDGVNKLSTEFGLTIDGSCVDIHRSGEEMHNSLDETGMYVRRGDEIMLQANNKGVIATDVTVRNYLIIGQHARFEDYSNGADAKRTGCFWI